MIDLSILLTDIRDEIDRLTGDGVPQDEAEQQAVTSVMARAAYAQTASPHETRIITIIDRLSLQSRAPVSTHSICAEIGSDYFATYYHLRNMERRGLLVRPRGPRSGWKVAS